LQLRTTNAALRRINLFCGVASPFAFGALISFLPAEVMCFLLASSLVVLTSRAERVEHSDCCGGGVESHLISARALDAQGELDVWFDSKMHNNASKSISEAICFCSGAVLTSAI
jgi:hypothetical protein